MSGVSWRDLMLTGAAVVAALGVTIADAGRSAAPKAFAAALAGQLTIVQPGTSTPLAGGTGTTGFELRFPGGSAQCPHDSAGYGYRVDSYLVGVGVDPGTLVFDPSGPTPVGVGVNVRLPLISGGTPFVDRSTASPDTAGGPADILALPTFSFGAFLPDATEFLGEGVHNLGIACTTEDGVVDVYWNTQIEFTWDATAALGITWAAVGPGSGATTTTTTTTTTVAGGSSTTTTTTTVAGGSSTTSTTVAGGSTTTSTTLPGGTAINDVVAGGSVTLTGDGFTAGEDVEVWLHSDPVRLATVVADADGEVSVSVTIPAATAVGAHQIELLGVDSGRSVVFNVTVTDPAGGSSSTSSTSSTSSSVSSAAPVAGGGGGFPQQQIPATGTSTWTLVSWAVAVMALGRMVILIARQPRVIEAY